LRKRATTAGKLFTKSFFLNEHYSDHLVFFEESPAIKKTKPTKRTPKGKKIPRMM